MPTLDFPVLVADIGGTNARFALVPGPDKPTVSLGQTETRLHATLADALEAAILPRLDTAPKSFVFAVAGPVHPEVTRLTNCPWEVEPRALVRRFGLSAMVVINDFEAQALALPALRGKDLVLIGTTAPAEHGTRLVVGPGTGLGAAALVEVAGSFVPVPGEGGHIGVGPVTARDLAIWPHLPLPHGTPGSRISAEMLLQGAGLVRLAEAIARTDHLPQIYASPAEVTAGAARGEAVAREAVALFCDYLGRVIGDLALVFLPTGGVFLAGGIAPRILDTLQEGAFRAGFEDKWPHGEVMKRFATAVVVHPQSGLLGLETFARAPERFAVDLKGRIWG